MSLITVRQHHVTASTRVKHVSLFFYAGEPIFPRLLKYTHREGWGRVLNVALAFAEPFTDQGGASGFALGLYLLPKEVTDYALKQSVIREGSLPDQIFDALGIDASRFAKNVRDGFKHFVTGEAVAPAYPPATDEIQEAVKDFLAALHRLDTLGLPTGTLNFFSENALDRVYGVRLPSSMMNLAQNLSMQGGAWPSLGISTKCPGSKPADRVEDEAIFSPALATMVP